MYLLLRNYTHTLTNSTYFRVFSRQMGQLFMMGFDGTSVSPQIRSLIENHHLGSVLLSTKNLKCIMSLVLYLISSSLPFSDLSFSSLY